MTHQACEKCKTLLQTIMIIYNHDDKNTILPKPYCPYCKTLRLTDDDLTSLVITKGGDL